MKELEEMMRIMMKSMMLSEKSVQQLFQIPRPEGKIIIKSGIEQVFVEYEPKEGSTFARLV